MNSLARSGLFVALCGAALCAIGCDSSPALRSGGCTPGETRACTCPNGSPSTQSCNPQSGLYAACLCANTNQPDAGPPVGPGPCGDGVCNSNENCETCEDDCGFCPQCNYAPSCSEAQGVPLSPTAEGNLNIPGGSAWSGTYDSNGINDCTAARLRMRLTQIHGNKSEGQMYCIVQATDGIQSGVAITPQTPDLKDGDTYQFDPSVGMFWSKNDPDPRKALVETKNNMTITYNCIQVKKPGVLQQVLMAAGNAAGAAGQFGGAYGWAFGVGDIALQAAAAALAASNGDNNLFNAQHIIDKNELLDLTNGKTWTVTAGGGDCDCNFLGFSCDTCSWTLTIEAWGCAGKKPTPQ